MLAALTLRLITLQATASQPDNFKQVLWVRGQQQQFRRAVARRWERSGAAAQSAGTVASPMPGRIIKVFVSLGEEVEEGATLCVVEAMKMEHAVRAPCSGMLGEVHAYEGAQVQDGQLLAVVVPAAVEEKAVAGGEA